MPQLIKRHLFTLLAFTALGLYGQPVKLTAQEKLLLETSIPEYLSIIYPPEIPRAFDVHRLGCPVCGEAIKKHGTYSWIMSREKPFKLQCPECNTVFPDNDFEAYWKSGFKDKSLLTGKYVDDGWGWRPAPNQPKYWFVAYYAHWMMSRDVSVTKLSDAYRRTKEAGFARRALAILDKYAERYPDYDYSKQSRYAQEINRGYKGRIVNSIWETGTARRFATAYYKVMDFLEKGDAELEQALGKSCAQIKHDIEDNMLRVMANDIMTENGKINGNYGMHQNSLLDIAKCFHDTEMIKWVTDFRKSSGAASTPLGYALFSNIFGDGAPMESPGYNCGWLNNICTIIQALYENGVDVFAEYPTARRLYTYSTKMVVCGRSTTSSGDTGNTRNRGVYCASYANLKFVFEHHPDPQVASLLKHLKPNDAKAGELALENFGYESNLLSGYGMATLQNGNKEAPTAVVLDFPNYIGHRHNDSLNLNIFAENVAMTPDFGYPESASNDDPTRAPYYDNTLAHNTVVVNASRQPHYPGSLLEYDRGPVFQRMAAACDGIYEATSLYRRAVTTVEVAPGKTIVFDIFRVKGGHQHDWFMHSCGESFSWEQKLTSQGKGTLAGPDVAYGSFYDRPKFEEMKKRIVRSYSGYDGSGYQFLTDVCWGNALPGVPILLPPTSDSSFKAAPGAMLKLYPLGQDETIYFSHGKPPRTQRLPQKHVVFVTRRRSSQDENLESLFPTVLETSSEATAAHDIERVQPISPSADAAAVKIFFKDGKLLYLFDAEEETGFTVDGIKFSGRAGGLLIDQAVLHAYVVGSGGITYQGKGVVRSGADFSASVAKVDLFGERITLDRDVPGSLAGRTFRVGKHAYIADRIEGRTIAIRDQSTIRGRFRLLEHNKGTKNEGRAVPSVVLANPGMSLYTANGEFHSKMDIEKGIIKAEKDLDLNVDYWISECGDGDEVFFPSSARLINLPR